MDQTPPAFWSFSAPDTFQHLHTSPAGLSSAEATQRLAQYGSNRLQAHQRSDVWTLLLAQFKSPIILILFFAMGRLTLAHILGRFNLHWHRPHTRGRQHRDG